MSMNFAYDALWKMPRRRIWTAKWRGLPKFMIIGVEKGGTSSLAMYLNAHPRIAAPYAKESRYFTKHYKRGLSYYRCNFPFQAKLKLFNQMSYDASPTYIFFPGVAKRIKESGMQFKFIVLLRDPVKRAYSHYNMIKRMKASKDILGDRTTFRQLIEYEINNPIDPQDFHRAEYATVVRGYYANQLKRWFKYFSRDQFLILKTEDLKTNTVDIVNQTIEFLGLDSQPMPTEYKAFYNFHSHEYQPMSQEDKDFLQAHYQPYNQQLYRLLGRDFGW